MSTRKHRSSVEKIELAKRALELLKHHNFDNLNEVAAVMRLPRSTLGNYIRFYQEGGSKPHPAVAREDAACETEPSEIITDTGKVIEELLTRSLQNQELQMKLLRQVVKALDDLSQQVETSYDIIAAELKAFGTGE